MNTISQNKTEPSLVVTVIDMQDVKRNFMGEYVISARAYNTATQFIKRLGGLVPMRKVNKEYWNIPTEPKKIEMGYTANFNYGWCDECGIVQGLRSITQNASKTVTFVAATHPSKGGIVKAVLTVGIGIEAAEADEPEKATWRICGANNNPMSSGSESLIHSGDESLETACCMVAMRLTKEGCSIFRQPHPL